MTPSQLYDGILKAMNDKEAIELIEEAKKEWCKEQRESCLNNYKKKRGENLIKILETEDTEEINGVWDLNDSILNAPEP